MDKTVEIVVVAMVALVTGVVILYLATGQADGFGSFADNQQQNAQCDYYEERLSRASDSDERISIMDEAPDECDLNPDTNEDQGSSGDVDCNDPQNSGLPQCN